MELELKKEYNEWAEDMKRVTVFTAILDGGKKHGLLRYWNRENGILMMEMNYVNGKVVGLRKEYHGDDASISVIYTIDKDSHNGTCVYFKR